MFLLGTTSAYFNDIETLTLPLKTEWEVPDPPDSTDDWEKSSLEFIGESSFANGISATIKNSGSDMTDSVDYTVYYIPEGNPKFGVEVYKDSLPLLKKDEIYTLQYATTTPGYYKFKAVQREGHGNKSTGGKGNPEKALWSETITLGEVPKNPDGIIENPETPTITNDSPDTTSENPEITPETPNTDDSPDTELQHPAEDSTEINETNNDDTENIQQSETTTEETQ
ncbi:hypothetical protein ABE41_017175 [Fictibacillus arsenicus]|uniref:Amyloid fiber anchoring/assembly protein TapA n=2 Tax=Fictibacillus arsenicus TaxID=255247 RepID=A0A1B1Z8F8_9BACL|nr:hypothetical protein ABE41_017175 [Fictibacillus arsenicus]